MALVQLPIRTFAEMAAIDYGVQIHCPLCRRRSEVGPGCDLICSTAASAAAACAI
jgi:hypothetical protein